MFSRSPLFWFTFVLSVVYPVTARAASSRDATQPVTEMTGTVTLSTSGGTFSFDAGATPGCPGDISVALSGTLLAINVVGNATTYGVPGNGGSTEFDSLTEDILEQLTYTPGALFSSNPVNAVFAVHTNAGHYAKALVTAATGSSITVQYLTYEVTGGAPVILQVQSNYSSQGSVPYSPFSGIAPGSLFVVSGCGFAAPGSTAVLQDTTKGLPLALGGLGLSVAVNGVTTQAPLYYATPVQVAAVLPSATPVGTGTITATYNQLSSSVALVVQPAVFAFDTYYGTGAGMAVATDAAYQLVTYTNAAQPGQTITFWGSGLGAGPADSDTTYTPTPHPISVSGLPLHVLIGGIEAAVTYQGRSPYPGLDQIDVTIPQNVPTGCAVSVGAVHGANSAFSNFVTLPIAAGGGTCDDPLLGIGPSQVQSLSSKSTVNIGVLVLEQGTLLAQSGTAQAHFFSLPGSSLGPWLAQQYAGANADYPVAGEPVSLGSCVVGTPGLLPPAEPAIYWYQFSPLDVGFMALNTAAGTTWLIGDYQGTNTLPTEWTASMNFAAGILDFNYTGGSFTFAGSGGNDVGAFHTTLDFPMQETFPSLTLAALNANPLPVNSLGQTITWTGGDAVSYITISGNNCRSGSGIWGSVCYASFTCNVPSSAGQFTIPAEILRPLALTTAPATGLKPTSSSGTITIQVNTYPQPFSAPGLDAGYALGLITPVSVPVGWY